MWRDGLAKELVAQDVGTEEAFSLTTVSQRLLSSRTVGTVSKPQHGRFPEQDNAAESCAGAVGGDVLELPPSTAHVARAGHVVRYEMPYI